jgi:hypothetical protein
MKNFALVAAVALLALALPASAGETSETAPAAPLEQQIEGPLTPAELVVFRPPSMYCWDVNGTACPYVGAKRTCIDACDNQLPCTCNSSSGGRYWRCNIPC